MDWQHARKGGKLDIPADVWNALIDSAVAMRAQGYAQRNRPNLLRDQNAGVILVRNDSGAVIDPFHAIALKEPIVLPTENEDEFKKNGERFKAITPTNAHKGLWAIAQESLPADGWGMAVAVGVTVARLNLINKKDKWCETDAGTTVLRSAEAGEGSAQILWVAGGTGSADSTGEQWSVIRTPPGGELPTGEIQHQLYGMVTQNKAGWGLPLAVPDLKEIES